VVHASIISVETIVGQQVRDDATTRPVKGHLGEGTVWTGGRRTAATCPWAADPP